MSVALATRGYIAPVAEPDTIIVEVDGDVDTVAEVDGEVEIGD